MSDPAAGDSGIELDLIPPELIKPRLRKFAWITVIVAVVLAVLLGQFVNWTVGIVIPVALLGPVMFALVTGMRRRTTISGSVIRATAGVTRTVDLDIADEVSISVRQGRVTQVSLHADRVHIALAVYMGEGGREIPIQALKALADGLAQRHPDLSEVFMGQLRAEAIGAALPGRPLYRAAGFAESGHKATTLTDEQIRELTA